ncbi:MAG TPA: hypothetical protein VFB72_12355, partial [Verrucomicrobiae bacterium]|nr:hypothetical protein [Verrucomicrobiae bacterium]
EPIPQLLVDLLAYHAGTRDCGRISQAFRELGEVIEGTADPRLQIVYGWLSEDEAVAQFLRHDSVNKSYVPRRLRDAVRQDVMGMQDYRIGGNRLATSYAALQRYRDNMPSRFSFSADDVTLNVYFYVADGEGWFRLVRGQCIIVIDRRTLRVMGFSLQPDANYSSPVIHSVFSKVFADHGVPRRFLLEMGIWKNSRLITGAPQSETTDYRYRFLPHSWAETETGFGRLGIEIRHATRSRTKEVELVIGLLQNLMDGEPGYCGRAERHDLPEATKRQMEDVKYRRVDHPSKHFYSFEQWNNRLLEIIEKYNRTPQQGIILGGMSPDEADEKLQSADESKRPLFFDATCRWLLSQYVVKKEAGKDGITITVGKNSWRYCDGQLARDKFKDVLCWFNPADPSLLVVTDLKMKNPYTVQLFGAVDADDPNAPEFKAAIAQSYSYSAQTKARYTTLKAKFDPMFRQVHPSRTIVETGQQIRQQQEIIDQRREDTTRRKNKINRRASQLNIPAENIRPDTDADEGTALMLEAKRAHQKNKGVTP